MISALIYGDRLLVVLVVSHRKVLAKNENYWGKFQQVYLLLLDRYCSKQTILPFHSLVKL